MKKGAYRELHWHRVISKLDKCTMSLVLVVYRLNGVSCTLARSSCLLSMKMGKISRMSLSLATSGTSPRDRLTLLKVRISIRLHHPELTVAGLEDENEYLLVFDDGL